MSEKKMQAKQVEEPVDSNWCPLAELPGWSHQMVEDFTLSNNVGWGNRYPFNYSTADRKMYIHVPTILQFIQG